MAHTVDPAVAKLFDGESIDKSPQNISFRDKVSQKYQQKKSFMKIVDSESELSSDEYTNELISRNQPQSSHIMHTKYDSGPKDKEMQDSLKSQEIHIQSDSSFKDQEMILESDLAPNHNDGNLGKPVSEAPFISNDGLADIEQLMESTGYDNPAKHIPICFDDSIKMRDLESQIFNRMSGSVLETSNTTQGWIPWDLLLKQRLDKDLGVEKRFITFTMNFCTENGISPKSVTVGNHSSMGIPPNLMDKYVKEFTLRFFPSISPENFQEEVLEEGFGVAKPFETVESPDAKLSTERSSIIPSFDQVSALNPTPAITIPALNTFENDKKEPPMTRFNM